MAHLFCSFYRFAAVIGIFVAFINFTTLLPVNTTSLIRRVVPEIKSATGTLRMATHCFPLNHFTIEFWERLSFRLQSFPVYESFPLDLEAWLMETYGLYAADVYRGWPSARSARAQQICNGNGSCFELTRILADCCPFWGSEEKEGEEKLPKINAVKIIKKCIINLCRVTLPRCSAIIDVSCHRTKGSRGACPQRDH